MQSADYVAFFAMAVVFCGVIYLVIWLGDMPGNIARQRNHPQVAAVTALSWLGLLFTGGIAYIAAFVWAFYDYSDAGENLSSDEANAEIASLKEQIAQLQGTIDNQLGDKS